VVLFVSAAASARAGTLLMAAPYNVFTLGNFTDWGSDTQGALAAAGTVTLSSFQVAGSISPGAAFFTLVAGGNLIATSGSVNGKVYDGTPGQIGQSFTIAPGNLQSGGDSPIDFADAAVKLNALSDGLAGMATSPGNSCVQNYYWLQCTATQSGLNIFNIPDTSYLGNGHAPMITASDPNATIVLNIGGTSNTLTNGGWSINGISSQRVILNFYESTNLVLNGSVPVSILAPSANVTAPSGGALNGNFIAYSFSGQYQFNHSPFTGDLPSFDAEPAASTVPEPMTLALTGGALAGLLWLRRRK
jgi:choice-of-anchor A domain-containing protein